jgi:hypothetical protein
MKRVSVRLLILSILLFTALAGCGGNSPAATDDPNLVYTQIWQTVEFAQTQTALVITPTETPTHTPEASPTLEMTNTPLLSSTPNVSLATNTPLVRNTPVSPGTQPCDNGVFVADVTYPDGSEVVAGQPFVKTWRFRNTGPCDWAEDYHLIFGWQTEGANWQNTAPVRFNTIVEVGETFDISVTLTAPTAPGGYGAWFRLQNNKGFNFGEIFAVYVVVK